MSDVPHTIPSYKSRPQGVFPFVQKCLREISSFTLPETLLAADLYRSLFSTVLSTVDHGRLNFLVMSLVRAPSSLCSMIFIFVCRSVKCLDLLLLLGVICFSFRAHVYGNNSSTELQLCFDRKHLLLFPSALVGL